MTNAGRPTLYRPDYCELAGNYCLLGATNADLAAFFDVTTRTIDNWIATHPEFAAAVHEAKAMADARVARCLYQRAVGYDHTVERTVLHQGRAHTLTNKVHLPPDTRACIFWLRNRQPRLWSGRPTPPPDDDGIDDIALLDAASEAARHAPSHHGWERAAPVAPMDSAADGDAPREDDDATSGRAAAPQDDGADDIALPDADGEEAHHTARLRTVDPRPERSRRIQVGLMNHERTSSPVLRQDDDADPRGPPSARWRSRFVLDTF